MKTKIPYGNIKLGLNLKLFSLGAAMAALGLLSSCEKKCAGGCGENQKCENGKCVDIQIPTPPVTPPTDTIVTPPVDTIVTPPEPEHRNVYVDFGISLWHGGSTDEVFSVPPKSLGDSAKIPEVDTIFITSLEDFQESASVHAEILSKHLDTIWDLTASKPTFGRGVYNPANIAGYSQDIIDNFESKGFKFIPGYIPDKKNLGR